MAEACPRCGAQAGGERCPQCGLLIALYHASLEKLRRGPAAPPPASAAPSASTAVFSAPGPAAAATSPPPPTADRHLQFHGSTGSLFAIQAVNVLFTLLTLGIYYFWGKARVRAYLLSRASSSAIASPTTAPVGSC